MAVLTPFDYLGLPLYLDDRIDGVVIYRRPDLTLPPLFTFGEPDRPGRRLPDGKITIPTRLEVWSSVQSMGAILAYNLAAAYRPVLR